MTTLADIVDADDYGRKQRRSFAPMLQVDATKGDAETCKSIQAAAFGDGHKFDAILAHPQVNALFAAGALYYEARP